MDLLAGRDWRSPRPSFMWRWSFSCKQGLHKHVSLETCIALQPLAHDLGQHGLHGLHRHSFKLLNRIWLNRIRAKMPRFPLDLDLLRSWNRIHDCQGGDPTAPQPHWPTRPTLQHKHSRSCRSPEEQGCCLRFLTTAGESLPQLEGVSLPHSKLA